MADIVEHVHRSMSSPEPFRVKVERGQKGGYGWEISVSGDSIGHILDLIASADASLRDSYCSKAEVI
jgi:hypothetical protein